MLFLSNFFEMLDEVICLDLTLQGDGTEKILMSLNCPEANVRPDDGAPDKIFCR